MKNKLEPLRDEVWKPVVGFENYYEVSNLGNCRSLPRKITYAYDSKQVRTGQWKGKILKPTKKADGYLRYNLSIKGKVKRYSAHRMVALAFIQNPESKRIVNHLNSVRDDNRVENLEWATDSENVLHSYQNGNRETRFYGFCCQDRDIKLDKLISLKEFVLKYDPSKKQIKSFAEFLDMKLELWMFIPTDLEGNVLVEPIVSCYVELERSVSEFEHDLEQYNEAKERVVFDGFEVCYYDGKPCEVETSDISIHISEFHLLKIESLVDLKPTLTATGLMLSGKK